VEETNLHIKIQRFNLQKRNCAAQGAAAMGKAKRGSCQRQSAGAKKDTTQNQRNSSLRREKKGEKERIKPAQWASPTSRGGSTPPKE